MEKNSAENSNIIATTNRNNSQLMEQEACINLDLVLLIFDNENNMTINANTLYRLSFKCRLKSLLSMYTYTAEQLQTLS